MPAELNQSADCRLAWIPALHARKSDWLTPCLPRSHFRWRLERRALRVVPVGFLPLRAGPQPAELQLAVAQQLVAWRFAAQEVVDSLAGFHRCPGFRVREFTGVFTAPTAKSCVKLAMAFIEEGPL